VSHDLDAIQRLCSRVLWLETGRIREDGPTDEVVERYLAYGLAAAVERSFADDQSRPAAIHAVTVRDSRVGSSGVLRRGDPLEVTVRFQVHHPVPGIDLSLLLFNARGARLLDEAWSDHRTTESLPPGAYVAKVVIPPVLNTGDYTIGVWLGTAYETIQYINDAAVFRLEGPTRGRTERLLQLGMAWSVEPTTDAIEQTSLRKLP
jgi:ABC-2 type transport system ATP-binding protein/lipopolysaccharide transport system ATP-binding protein